MKYPELLSFAQILPELGRIDTLIDTRSPGEFEQDHIPGAINCPVLDDAERIRVGTLYKQVNAFEAKKVGAALVAKNIARHIETLWLDHPREWRPLVYCWRGGNRSGAMAHILAKIGWPVAQLEGGYKAYRQHVVASLEQLPQALSFRVLCGPTGCGKSRLLHALARQGAQVLDLEQLAAHRGSVLGHLPDLAQPGQKAFESRLWDHLHRFDPERVVYVEAESKKVGNLRIPEALMQAIRHASCLTLALPESQRIGLLLQDYQHLCQHPALLGTQLSYLTPIHGRDKITHWQSLVAHGEFEQLITGLLHDHYDPAYQRSIGKNFPGFGAARQVALHDSTPAELEKVANHIMASER